MLMIETLWTSKQSRKKNTISLPHKLKQPQKLEGEREREKTPAGPFFLPLFLYPTFPLISSKIHIRVKGKGRSSESILSVLH